MLTMALHDAQEFYNDLGGGSDEHLALATAFGIDDVVLELWVNMDRKPIGILRTRQSF